MGLFSKTIDYNLILEEVLDKKRFSANNKSLLLSMLYKVETSYQDYARVKHISKTKDQFVFEIIHIVREYLDILKTVEPDSENAKILKKYDVIALTNEKERSALSYPTETAILYAIADIEPKYFYIENFFFKEQFQQILVEGSNINTIEILEDFTGWSWNPKPLSNKNCLSNLIYQNLIMMFGIDYIDNCKKDNQKEYDIIKMIKKNSVDYYNSLIDVIYLKNKNTKFDRFIEKKIEVLKKFEDIESYQNKKQLKIDRIKKKIEKIDYLLKDEKKLKRSFLVKNSKLDDDKKIKTLKSYMKLLNKEKADYISQIEELENEFDVTKIREYKEELEIAKRLQKLDKTLEDAVIELQVNFLKILYKQAKEVETRDEFIDIIYKIRYYRNIYLSKDKAIKDYLELEKIINKIFAKVITLGSKNAYIRMVSFNINLNAKILISCLDSKSMEIENLRLNIDDENRCLNIEVFENKIFEKKFKIQYNIQNPELTIKKKRTVKIFT